MASVISQANLATLNAQQNTTEGSKENWYIVSLHARGTLDPKP